MLARGAEASAQGETRTRTPSRAPISETGVYSSSSHLSEVRSEGVEPSWAVGPRASQTRVSAGCTTIARVPPDRVARSPPACGAGALLLSQGGMGASSRIRTCNHPVMSGNDSSSARRRARGEKSRCSPVELSRHEVAGGPPRCRTPRSRFWRPGRSRIATHVVVPPEGLEPSPSAFVALRPIPWNGGMSCAWMESNHPPLPRRGSARPPSCTRRSGQGVPATIKPANELCDRVYSFSR